MDFQAKECIKTWVWCVAQGHLHSGGGTRGTWTLSGLVVRRTCQTFWMNGPSAFSHDSLLTPNTRSLVCDWCILDGRDRWLWQSKSWGPGTPEDHWTSGLSVPCFCSVVHGSPWHWATAHTLMCIPHTLWYLLFNSHHKLTEWRYHWLTQMMISKWGTCHSSGLWSAWEIKMGDRSPFLQFIFVFAGAELGLCL